MLLVVGLLAAAVILLWSTTPPLANRPFAAIPPSPRGEGVAPWEPIFAGVERCQAFTDQPRLMRIYAVRVDLRAPGVDFLVTPGNGRQPKDANARTTSGFLREFKCQVAINGSPFAMPLASAPGDPLTVLGLSLSRGDLYSSPSRYDALMISADRRLWIARPPIDLRDAYNGLCGFHVLLVKDVNQGDDSDCHPRSAVGISRDGRFLLLMAIDGRQVGYSESATTRETAEWLRRLGAYDALNLDGGGSTTLVIEGPNGEPLRLNRPSGGAERPVANHLGVYARPLESRE